MVVTMKNTVLVRKTPYSPVEIYRSFRGKYLSPLQKCSGDRDHSSEISVNFCQTLVFPVPTWITKTIYNSSNELVTCLRAARFWAITQRVVVIPYRRFGGILSLPSLRIKNLRSSLLSREHRDTLKLHYAADVLWYSSHYLDSHEILRILLWIFGL